MAEAFPDLVPIEGVVDKSLIADLVSVGGVFFVGAFELVACCDILPVIGLRGCAFFSFFISLDSVFFILRSSTFSDNVATRWYSCWFAR